MADTTEVIEMMVKPQKITLRVSSPYSVENPRKLGSET